MQNHGLENEVLSGVYRTPKKDYSLSFDNTMVLKTRMFVASKYPTTFENHIIFAKLYLSNTPKILCIQSSKQGLNVYIFSSYPVNLSSWGAWS